MGLILFIVGVGTVLISGVAAALIKFTGFALMTEGVLVALSGVFGCRGPMRSKRVDTRRWR